jgi:hypothetical protein
MTANLTGVDINIYLPDHIAVSGGPTAAVNVPTLAQNNGTTTTAPFTAKIYGSNGEPVENQTINWSVAKGTDMNPAGVSIGTDGAVTVTKDAAAGTYVVTATSGSYTAGTKEFTVNRADPAFTSLVFENGKIGGFEFSNNTAAVSVNGGSPLRGQLQDSNFTALDQFGADMDDKTVSYAIYTDEELNNPYQPAAVPDISVAGGDLFVSPTAATGTYFIKAYNGEVYTKLTVDITRYYAINKVNINTENAHGTSDIANYTIAGDTVEFTVTPLPGYTIREVLLGTTALTAKDGKYSFTMPASDATVAVNYDVINPEAAPVDTTVETTYGTGAAVGLETAQELYGLTYSRQWFISINGIAYAPVQSATGISYTTDASLAKGTYYYKCRVTLTTPT